MAREVSGQCSCIARTARAVRLHPPNPPSLRAFTVSHIVLNPAVLIIQIYVLTIAKPFFYRCHISAKSYPLKVCCGEECSTLRSGPAEAI